MPLLLWLVNDMLQVSMMDLLLHHFIESHLRGRVKYILEAMLSEGENSSVSDVNEVKRLVHIDRTHHINVQMMNRTSLSQVHIQGVQ